MAIFYADSAGSQGTGDGSSPANACTLNQFITNAGVLYASVAAGDICYCKNGTEIVFNGASGVFATTAVAGTDTAMISVIGYATSIGDDGVVQIRDSNVGATNNALTIAHSNWRIRNFRFVDCRRGVVINSSLSGTALERVEVVNAAVSGIDVATSTDVKGVGLVDVMVRGTRSTSSSNAGFLIDARAVTMIRCASIDNASNGFRIVGTYPRVISQCISAYNARDGFNALVSSSFERCASIGNGIDGFSLAGTCLLSRCVSGLNAGYGVRTTGMAVAHDCALQSTSIQNTSGKSAGAGTLIEVAAITGDPLFANAAPSNPLDLDLRIGSGSSLAIEKAIAFLAATGAQDAGPYQRTAGGSVPQRVFAF
jgi:hypothetical protein